MMVKGEESSHSKVQVERRRKPRGAEMNRWENRKSKCEYKNERTITHSISLSVTSFCSHRYAGASQ